MSKKNVCDEYAKFAGPAEISQDDSLAVLSMLANQLAEMQADLLVKEAAVKDAKDAIKDLAEGQIPELMDRLGIGSFKTTTGLTIKVEDSIHANITAAKSMDAFNWLREHNFSALIERKVILSFGPQDDEANKLLLELIEKDSELAVEDKESVHHSRLKSWVKKQLEAGNEIPLDLFGVHKRRVAEVDV